MFFHYNFSFPVCDDKTHNFPDSTLSTFHFSPGCYVHPNDTLEIESIIFLFACLRMMWELKGRVLGKRKCDFGSLFLQMHQRTETWDNETHDKQEAVYSIANKKGGMDQHMIHRIIDR